MPLVEKLAIFNIVALENSEKNIKMSSDFYIENFQYPNVLFIIGLLVYFLEMVQYILVLMLKNQ